MMLVDKENGKSYVEVEETKKHDYASKTLAGTALGFGIGGVVLSMLNGGLSGLGLFGRSNNTVIAGEITTAQNEQYLERKECQDVVALTSAMWQQAYNAQAARQEDRNVLNGELFGLYSAMHNGFDGIVAAHNKDSFDLYKYSRDSKDELSNEIGALRTEIAILKATRPYQDALIQCDIRRAAEHADFNLWRRTCRMITGELVLPSTPTVTGYPSYNPCNAQSATTTPAA